MTQSQLNDRLSRADEFLSWNFGPQGQRFWDDLEEVLRGNSAPLDAAWVEAELSVEQMYPDMGMCSMRSMKERFGPWDGPEEWRYAARLEETVKAATLPKPWEKL